MSSGVFMRLTISVPAFRGQETLSKSVSRTVLFSSGLKLPEYTQLVFSTPNSPFSAGASEAFTLVPDSTLDM